MNRRNFLRNIGLAGLCSLNIPILSSALEKTNTKNKSIVVKIDSPIIELHSNGKSKRLLVRTYSTTLKELKDTYQNHYIYFYNSQHFDITAADGSKETYSFTRAVVIEKSKISHPASISFVHPKTKETIRYDIIEYLFVD